MAGVIPDDEDDVARLAGVGAVLADCPRDVDARDGAGRDRPGGRYTPVAAVDQAGSRVGKAIGLALWQAGGRLDRRNLPRALPAIVAKAIDVQAVVVGVRLHLERDGLPLVDAHVGGVALNRVVTGSDDVPLAGWIARLAVLGHDR